MSIQAQLKYQWCGHDDFMSQRGLTQHLQRSQICHASAQAAASPDFRDNDANSPLNRFTDGNEIWALIFDNQCIISDLKSLLKSHDLDEVACIIGTYFDDDIEDLTTNESDQMMSIKVMKRPQIQAKINLTPSIHG
jgi:hypothetical protein